MPVAVARRGLPLMAHFDVESAAGMARAGRLAVGGRVLETPGLLLHCKRGHPVHLTPDTASQSGLPTARQLDATEFLTAPSPETYTKHPAGARGFVGAGDGLLVATARDPRRGPHDSDVSSPAGPRVFLTSGAMTLTPAGYSSLIAGLEPDLFTALADVPGHAAAARRSELAVQRTLQWLDACLGDPAPGHGPQVLASVVGGSSPELRALSARQSARRSVAGFSLCALSPEGDVPKWRGLIEAATAQLPPALPRLLLGALSPQHMLQAVRCGADIFDSSYAVDMAVRGHAVSLEVPELQAPSSVPAMEAAIKLPASPGTPGQTAEQLDGPAAGRRGRKPHKQQRSGQQQGSYHTRASAGSTSGELGTAGPSLAPAYQAQEMNLWAAEYRADQQPLVPGCSCYACRTHTRAYVHHLLEESEMTAQVLLEVHNTVQLQAFLARVRLAVRTGGLQELEDV